MSASRNPKLSIGMPVYNAEKYLAKTLDGLLAQTFTDFEIIISDNASTDATLGICDEFVTQDDRVHLLRSPVNRGAAWNFNNTFTAVQGSYFKWAAHDDLHAPTFLQRCVDVLDSDPSIVLCFAGTTFIDAEDREIKIYEFPVDLYQANRRERFRYYAVGGHIVHEVFGLIRTAELRKTALIGGYLGSDLVMLGQLALQGAFFQVPEQLFMHREHEQRSMINPQGAKNKTQWYDASKSGAFVMPYWRRAFENAKSILRMPMPLTDRFGCAIELARACWWNSRYLIGELKSVIVRSKRQD